MDAALKNGSLSVVLASWHLVETAHTKNANAALELAEFIDGLQPRWILERRDIAAIEVAIDFWTFASIKYSPPPLVGSRSALFAALNRQPESKKFDIPATAFVKQWMEHPEQLEPIEKSCKDNVESLVRLREMQKEGKITPEVRQKVTRTMIEMVLPAKTPEGLDYGRELRESYLQQVTVNSIPILAIETAISQNEWGAKGGADRKDIARTNST